MSARRLERRHEPITGALHLLAAVLLHLLAEQLVARAEYVAGGLIAKAVRQVRRANDVREEDSNGAFGELLRHGEHLAVSSLIIGRLLR